MVQRSRASIFGCAALALLLGSLSCSGLVKDEKMEATVQAEVERLSQGGQGHGFICFGDADGGVGCVCKDDAPAGDIWSCVGMERVCNALGTGQICNPSTDWCHCVAIKKS